MASEKMRSRFRESITSMPATPSADAQTLKKLEGDFPSVLSPQSPERPLRGYPPSRSGHSSFSGTPVMNPPDAKEPALVAKYLARRATLLGWFEEPAAAAITSGWSSTCVALKKPDGTYAYAPDDPSPDLVAAVARLEENAVVSMASEVTNTVLDTITPDQASLLVESTGARIPIVPSLADVRQSLVHSTSSCIVVQERCVLIWSNVPNTVINVAHNVEKQLLGFIVGPSMPRGLLAQTEEQSIDGLPTPVRGAIDEKNSVYQLAIKVEEGEDADEDLEGNPPVRPALRVHSFRIGIVMILVILTQSMGVSKLLHEFTWDGDYKRFILVVVIPPLCLLSLFFFIVVVSSVFQLLLPAGMCLRNSRYHSAVKPNRKRYVNYELPHITVQMPVYKEGLRGVVVPTMVSVMAAIQYYENQGGTASVFINDDGMQCIQPELAAARKQYYRENGIGYCARMPTMKTAKGGGFLSWFKRSPPVDPEVDNQDESELSPQGRANKLGFVRKGKFKKASNMNYCLAFSNRVEDELHRLTELECTNRNCTYEELSAEDDDALYEVALQNMLDADEGKTWAEGNIRMGEIILIIDCDTRVPIDCLLYGALEMHESPEVAILQHGSGVMQVAHNIFENGITYFTNIVYTAIKYGVGTGDVAPFVGHNAFLRWKAIQSVAFVDPSDGITKWWSDSHVSEDFDISLRIQVAGMDCRLATYHNGGFEEGVSLTVYDELNRWEKYAYGCNELVFHPFYQWPYKGPVTRLFLRFLWSSMPVSSKVSIIAYIFTYYAIAAGMLLTVVNYVLVGLFFMELDHFYTPSWGIWVSLLVVFNGVASISFSMTRHRLKERSFWVTILETVKWLPFLLLFFGGISINCAKALLCHAFSVNIEWASTSKELGPTGIYIGLNKMMHRFKYTFLICFVIAGGMIYMAVGAPWGWTIAPGQFSTGTYAIVPLAVQVACSFTLPLFLGLT
ncbi:glycosyl transferase family group 2-domain-containing protein [Ilyonectria robusta]|uniref:glycosyl transferase family group 2-domain-containing protein n=1 Tax=Ilyonectria robusta TaxID=1079257 RepID=UPI001E8DCD91|nr:glycosyl transferase family group 2-domain-containing protein [Ilyonectria robusta]KAH8684988.1 glycosyl transferase family group 2-domain-containing protein [Ilyonectria robusta]